MDIKKAKLKNMEDYISFYGDIYIIGHGAIGSVLLGFIQKTISSYGKIYVIDGRKFDLENVEFINKYVREDNYREIFGNLKENDLVIDCSIDVCTLDMIKLCQEKHASYVNSSIETWNYKGCDDPKKYSLYYKYNELVEYSDSLDKKYFTALIGSGCNPGMVSIWAKVGLDKINEYYDNSNGRNEPDPIIDYGETAKKLGLETIHISEIDTQTSCKPKQPNEYCNTWSSTMEPFYQECIAPVELTWGAHENNTLPYDVLSYDEDERYMVFDKLCINTYAKSYTPVSKNFIGRLVRHEENYTIGKTMSVVEDGKTIYCPSVYYVYHPCNDTMSSLHELTEKNYTYQSSYRLLSQDIISGADELGLTFFLNHKGKRDIFWCGSILDNKETLELFGDYGNINATIVQVVGGYLAGIFHVIRNMNSGIYEGVISTDDLPHKKIFEEMEPFYGTFVFDKIDDWDFNMKNKIKKYSDMYLNNLNNSTDKNSWKFEDFLVD